MVTNKKTKKPKNKVVEWKEEMEYHGRRKKPKVHTDEKGKTYVMVRSRGGGIERLYTWKKYLVSNKTKAKTKNPTTEKPKKRKKSKKKEDNSIFYLIGAGIVGFLGYKLLKKESSAKPGPQEERKILSYREWRNQRRQRR